MHMEWEALIPFYLSGKISRHERKALEAHLAECQLCRQHLDEWKAIEYAVIAQIERLPRELPPLTIRQEFPQFPAYSNGYNRQNMPRGYSQSRKQRSGAILPITLAAVSCSLLSIAGIILYVLLATNSQINTATDIKVETIVLTASFTPTLTATLTSIPTQNTITLSATPLKESEISTPLPTFDETNLLIQYPCLIGNAQGQSINLYSGPDTRFVVLTQINQFNNTIVLNHTSTNWHQVKYVENTAIWLGWVNGDETDLFGSCSNLPIIEVP